MKKNIVIQRLTSRSDEEKTFTVNRNEHFTLIIIATSDAKYTAKVRLSGEGAQADIFGIILGDKAKTVTLDTIQDHQAPRTTSNLLIKSALTGRSQLHYEGLINVAPKAQQTNAYQRNENLMLSAEAKAETKPALEILANDVRCTHSATITKIDPEQLFYLQSRGLQLKKAEALIVSGFFQVFLDKIEDKKIRRAVVKRIGLLLKS